MLSPEAMQKVVGGWSNLRPFSFPNVKDDRTIVEELGLADTFQLEGITFKAPQILSIAHGICVKKDIISLDKGMGKTIVYLSIMHFSGVTRFLILCSNNAKLTQAKHLDKYFPHLTYAFVESKNKDKRAVEWRQDVNVLIATPATFLADMGKHSKSTGRIIPDSVANLPKIYDEYHKQLRSRKSGLFQLLGEVENPYLLLSSGSAGGKGPQDLWAALHLCNRVAFRGYWPYVNKYTEVEQSRWGRTISGVKNIDAWRREISAHCFHRRKDLKDYPPKTRQTLNVEMEPWQKKIHDQLRNELWAIWKDEMSGQEKMILTPNTLAATMKIRQFLVCPKLLDEGFGYGAGLEGIWADVEESELTHWVISTPFRVAIPYISQFFSAHGKGGVVFMGGEYDNAQQLGKAIDRWTLQGGPAIQTIRFAESYELPAARIMYMLGYEYSADQNGQAEDRIHRDIRVTPHPVDIYYVKHQFSYEATIIEMMAEGADIQHALMTKPVGELFMETD